MVGGGAGFTMAGLGGAESPGVWAPRPAAVTHISHRDSEAEAVVGGGPAVGRGLGTASWGTKLPLGPDSESASWP